jgi:hypothetical protein
MQSQCNPNAIRSRPNASALIEWLFLSLMTVTTSALAQESNQVSFKTEVGELPRSNDAVVITSGLPLSTCKLECFTC